MNRQLKNKLLSLLKENMATREKLAKNGSLFEGYNPEMEKIHLKNAKVLEEIINEFGWPGKTLVGIKGAEAAWIILQHAISRPDLQRKLKDKLEVEVKKGEVEAKHLAMLIDRINFFEGKPQVYGTNLDWDDEGNLKPTPIEDEKNVDKRRENVDLPPLPTAPSNISEFTPKDIQKRRQEFIVWAIKVGWRN